MFLDPRYHGQGYGKAMMDHAIAHKGALRAEVFKRNKIGRAFYDRYGFRGSEEHIHEPTGEVVIRMAFVRQWMERRAPWFFAAPFTAILARAVSESPSRRH